MVDIIETPILSKQQRKMLKKKAYKQRKKDIENKQQTTSEELTEVTSDKPTEEELATIKLKEQAKINLQKWEDMANLIGDFIKERKQMPNMRSGHEVECVLARWLFVQKHSYKTHKMHPYHVTRLKEVGVKLQAL